MEGAARLRRGFWLETASVTALELGASAGFDLVVLDLEHGVGLAPEAADTLILLGLRLGLEVYARIADQTRSSVQHALDAGATGVIIPQIEGAEAAARAAELCKYPPLGKRGMGYGRTMYAGRDRAFVDLENARTKCFIMIETPGALAEVETIAALPAVDGLFIGPADLSLTRGRGLYAATETDRGDHRRVTAATRAARKTWAMPATTRETMDFAHGEGADFVVVADDMTALRTGFAAALEATNV